MSLYMLDISIDTYLETVGISLHNRSSELWLPDAGTAGTGDSQEFLLAAPEPDIVTPIITLEELKGRIASINAELNAGDGSDAYRQCISWKHANERIERVRMSQPNYTAPYEPTWDGSFASGQLAGSELYEYYHGYIVTEDGTETKPEFWIDGEDAVLFSITEGAQRPGFDENVKQFSYSVVSARPVPAGTYEFNHHYIPFGVLVCEHTYSFEITADVIAPEGVLHELFFDPVTVDSTVAADSANGVLKPATFLDTNRASATIERIAWESSSTGPGQSGTVKLEVNPDDALAGHILEFVELDGTVSLSLDDVDAVVDSVNDTLSWTVAEQPWEDGDLLMVRILGEPPTCSGGTVVPNPADSPELVKECEALILVKETLAGTAELNWSLDVPITGWDGITVSGTPLRITSLALPSRGLNGRIPAQLGILRHLSNLDLSDNQLTGPIPSELGSLGRITRLRLAGNSFTWCVPVTFRDVKDSDHHDVDLFECMEYGQGRPASEGSAIFASVSAGSKHTCGIQDDGSLVCWSNASRHLTDPPAGKFTSVSVGGNHTCGLRADGTVECRDGGLYVQAMVPRYAFSSISAGGSHTCGLKTGGSVACWGSDEFGQSSPPPGEFASVSAGSSHTCGVKTNSSVACWGSNEYGESSPPDGRFLAVSVGEFHACGIRTDGSLVCWGSDERGYSSPPHGEFASVSVGGSHACGVKVDGIVACWGNDFYGQTSPPGR